MYINKTINLAVRGTHVGHYDVCIRTNLTQIS